MPNIKLTFEYDGTRYCGFQKQKSHNTIQAELERALHKLYQENIRIISSGRTDAGVHAKGHVANYFTDKKLSLDNIKRGLNSYLPKDIAIKSAQFVPKAFHARFSAKEKIYRYHIWNQRVRSPLNSRYAYHYVFPLNVVAMKKTARILIGKHDFRAFTNKSKDKENTVRTLRELSVKKRGGCIILTFRGDGFLYNMVRNLVGTLLSVGRGELPMLEVQKLISCPQKKKAGPTVPPQGLVLDKVIYT